MPKVYRTPTGTEKGGTEHKEPAVRKTFGVYDKPVRASSPAMIAALIVAALVIFFVVMMLMRH